MNIKKLYNKLLANDLINQSIINEDILTIYSESSRLPNLELSESDYGIYYNDYKKFIRR